MRGGGNANLGVFYSRGQCKDDSSVSDELQLPVDGVRRAHARLDLRRADFHALHGTARGLPTQPVRPRGPVQQTLAAQQSQLEVSLPPLPPPLTKGNRPPGRCRPFDYRYLGQGRERDHASFGQRLIRR